MKTYENHQSTASNSNVPPEEDTKFLNVDEKAIWKSLNPDGKEKMLKKAKKRHEREIILKKWSTDREQACALYVRILTEAAGTKGEDRIIMTERLNEAREKWHNLKHNKPRFF